MLREPSNSSFSRLRLPSPPFSTGGFRGNVNIVTYELLSNFFYFKFSLSNTAIRYAARARQLIWNSSYF